MLSTVFNARNIFRLNLNLLAGISRVMHVQEFYRKYALACLENVLQYHPKARIYTWQRSKSLSIIWPSVRDQLIVGICVIKLPSLVCF